MKYLGRIGCELFGLMLLAGLLGTVLCLAQSPSATSPSLKSPSVKSRHGSPPAAILRSVKVITDAEGPAIEIVTSSSQALNPTIESLESPPRLVIDLPNTRDHLPPKPLAGESAGLAGCESISFRSRRR